MTPVEQGQSEYKKAEDLWTVARSRSDYQEVLDHLLYAADLFRQGGCSAGAVVATKEAHRVFLRAWLEKKR